MGGGGGRVLGGGGKARGGDGTTGVERALDASHARGKILGYGGQAHTPCAHSD